MIVAVVPAGGKSTRMGRPKLLLPLAGRPVLAHLIHALQAGGADRVLVVAAPHLPELVPLAQSAGADAFVLPLDSPDMRATVEAGLAWVEHAWAPAAGDAWLLAPADHPTLEPAAVRRLIAARTQHPERSIFLPTHAGRRGHPVLLGWHHVSAIRALPAGQSLNQYIRTQSAATLEVPVASPAVLLDLDTPEDYERLLRQLEGPSAPPPAGG